MTICEPCNYASSVAYYHIATEMCHNKDSLIMSEESYVAAIRSFSFLAFASSGRQFNRPRPFFRSLFGILFGLLLGPFFVLLN